MQTLRTLLLFALAAGLSGCGQTTHYAPKPPDGGSVGTDADAYVPRALDLVAMPDGLPTNVKGPTITVIAPAAGATVVGSLLEVQATVADPDGVDPSTVTVTLSGGQPQVMTQQLVADQFKALVEMDKLVGATYLVVAAEDIL